MKNVKRNATCIRKSIQVVGVGVFLVLGAAFFAQGQVADERAENMQNGLFTIFMSADQSYYKFNSASDNDPYVYGYWVTAHALETLADAYQRTRNVVYYNRMKSILAGIRKYNRYGAGTYHNDFYDDLEWLCLACFNCYNATRDTEFLDAVHQMWTEIKTGYSGGKMSWRKGCTTPCNNSIANSPAIVIAVKLYKLEHDNAHLQMAKDIHAWMKANVFNANGGIWDAPGNFTDDWQFSYNSGMFISACLELSIVTGDQSYMNDAIKACEFVMNFRNYNGDYDGGVFFMNETGQGDGGLFKGVFAKSFADFIRMGSLTQAQKDRYLREINYTADYVWNNAVNKSSFLISPDWSVLPVGTIDVSTHVTGVHLFESTASLNKVHVYQDINYAGFYSQLSTGNYTAAALQENGITDNDITSLTIPAGYSVTVYENDNFAGASQTFTANTAWLADWNDRISSMKINDVSGPVGIYQDTNFSGYAAGLEAGEYTLAQLQALAMSESSISSLKIAPGYRVTLYDGDNFTGAFVDFISDVASLGDWSDKIRSIKVADLRGPVSVYGDVNFTGVGAGLDEGIYTLAQLQAKGISDNDISSLKIAPGFRVTAYDADDLTGESASFTSEAGSLADWNNTISSLKIADIRGPVSVYSEVDFGGYGAGLDIGNYTLSQLKAKGISDGDISSLKIAQGFRVTLYDGDDFTGMTTDLMSDSNGLSGWDNKATSLRIRANGDQTLSGVYELQNRNSNLYMSVSGGAGTTGDGAVVQQDVLSGEANQLFLFQHIGNGVYQITAAHSSKGLEVDPVNGKDDGTDLRQWGYYGYPNQQFIAVQAGDGYHKLVMKHSGKLIDAAASISPGTSLQQRGNEDQHSGMWKLTHPTPVNGTGDGLKATYYNGMNFQILRLSRKDATIDFDWATGSPDASVNIDQFSARWTGQIQPKYNGKHTFYAIADDGVKLWINNQVVIDKWRNDGGTEVSGAITLNAGEKYDIKLEYFENGGGAKVKLEWSCPAQLREVVPSSQLYSGADVVGVPELLPSEKSGITLYPNPGRKGGANELVIQLGRPSGQVSLRILDSQGKPVMNGQYQVEDSRVSVSVPSVSSGLYFIQVTDSGHTWTSKYIIE